MDSIKNTLLLKYDKLKEQLASFGRIAVAFSGGVDSTFLLFAAKDALGENAAAVTVSSEFMPAREINEAVQFCEKNKIQIKTLTARPLGNETIAANPPERCYYCKREIFGLIIDYSKRNGFNTVAEASNLDDNSDYRPGHRAIAEFGVKSPLRDIGFTKSEIRALSKYLGLPTWKKPSYACLATRIPYGDRLTAEKLAMAGKAEQLLTDNGFGQLRVRIHGNIARIELEENDFARFLSSEMREKVNESFKKLGFSYITLDIAGYRTGSMNETIEINKQT